MGRRDRWGARLRGRGLAAGTGRSVRGLRGRGSDRRRPAPRSRSRPLRQPDRRRDAPPVRDVERGPAGHGEAGAPFQAGSGAEEEERPRRRQKSEDDEHDEQDRADVVGFQGRPARERRRRQSGRRRVREGDGTLFGSGGRTAGHGGYAVRLRTTTARRKASVRPAKRSDARRAGSAGGGGIGSVGWSVDVRGGRARAPGGGADVGARSPQAKGRAGFGRTPGSASSPFRPALCPAGVAQRDEPGRPLCNLQPRRGYAERCGGDRDGHGEEGRLRHPCPWSLTMSVRTLAAPVRGDAPSGTASALAVPTARRGGSPFRSLNAPPQPGAVRLGSAPRGEPDGSRPGDRCEGEGSRRPDQTGASP